MAAKAGSAPVEFKAPTEAEFAAAVTKDMASGLKEVAEVRMLFYVIPLVLVLVVIAYLLSH